MGDQSTGRSLTLAITSTLTISALEQTICMPASKADPYPSDPNQGDRWMFTNQKNDARKSTEAKCLRSRLPQPGDRGSNQIPKFGLSSQSLRDRANAQGTENLDVPRKS